MFGFRDSTSMADLRVSRERHGVEILGGKGEDVGIAWDTSDVPNVEIKSLREIESIGGRISRRSSVS
jgi:hypothetical protein